MVDGWSKVETNLNIHNEDTIAVAHEVVNAAALAGYQVYFVWAAGPTGDHKAGLAIDFMVYAEGGGVKAPGPERPAVGNWIADYVWANRLRLGVRYEIFSRRIRSRTGTPPNVWLKYDGDDPHTNHVHVSRFSDARKYVSPKIAKPAAPLHNLYLSLFLESRKKEIHLPRTVHNHLTTVLVAEKALKKWGYPGNLVVDGHYGTSTEAACKWFQNKVSPGIKPSGQLGPKEWKRLSEGPNKKQLFIPHSGNYKKWI